MLLCVPKDRIISRVNGVSNINKVKSLHSKQNPFMHPCMQAQDCSVTGTALMISYMVMINGDYHSSAKIISHYYVLLFKFKS